MSRSHHPVCRQALSLLALSVWLVCAPAALAAEASPPAAATLPRELGKPEDDLKLHIRAFQVDGLPEASAPVLAALMAPYTGTGKGYEELINAAAAVTLHMQRDLGYYVGFAYVPEQSPQDGVIRLQALEGRLDQIEVDAGATPEQRALIESQLGDLKPGQILRTEDVERAVLLLNDLRGVSVRVEVSEGRQPGTASLRVISTAEPTLAGKAELDNLGNRYTGLARLSGSVTLANPLQRGDALSAQLLSSHTGGLKQATASYVTPLGAQGLKLGATASRVLYGLDKDDFPAVYQGSVTALGAYALYPMVRSRNLNLFGVISHEYKRFEDHQASARLAKRSHDWQLGLIGDSRDSVFSGGINTYELQALQGRMSFDEGANPLGLRKDFSKVTLGYSRLQNLQAGRWQLYGRLKVQWASTTLDASERYAAGGPLGVRAFAPGEAAADDAQVLNAELRWLPPESWLGPVARELAFSLFHDWAHVKFSKDAALQPASVPNTGTLSATGLGLIWDRPGDMAFRMDLAWRGAGDALADPKDHSPRANLVLTKRF